jgi:hypothetical protein
MKCTRDADAPACSNSRRQGASRRAVDTIGAAPVKAFGTRQCDDGSDGERDFGDIVARRQGRHAEEPATFLALAVVVVVRQARMMMAGLRGGRVIVVRADARYFSEAMHKRRTRGKGNCGNRCRQGQHIQRGEGYARAPAPMPE